MALEDFGGGINNDGSITVNESTFDHDYTFDTGGGYSAGGPATFTNCTFSNDTATSGGGAVNNNNQINPLLTIIGCTFFNDSTSGSGGAIINFATLTLTNCTISGNSAASSGGGLFNDGGTVTLGNTIVAGNTATTSGPDVFGTFASQGNNLIGKTDGSSGWVGSDLTGTIAQPLNPLLAPLGNYGGPTQTMALLPGSPAIDAGNNALIPAGVTTDQRGLPRIVNGTVDIGAFESSGFTIAVTSGSGQSADISEPFANPLVVTVTANNANEPVAGGQVTFTAPASGASASLSVNPATIAANGHGERDRHGQRHRRQLHRDGHGHGRDQHRLLLAHQPLRRLAGRQHDQRLRRPWPGSQHPPNGDRLRQHLRLRHPDDHLRPDRLRHRPDDHADGRPARAERHERDGDDHRPGGGRDGQRRRD